MSMGPDDLDVRLLELERTVRELIDRVRNLEAEVRRVIQAGERVGGL